MSDPIVIDIKAVEMRVRRGGIDECWEWIGAKDRHGYGVIRRKKGKINLFAHRLFYRHLRGEIGDLFVLHRCDNPSCVNPAHLFLGTQQDNVDDMIAKGRKVPPRGERNAHAKLTAAQVVEIRAKHVPYKLGGNIALCREYGISKTNLSHIVAGKGWKHV